MADIELSAFSRLPRNPKRRINITAGQNPVKTPCEGSARANAMVTLNCHWETPPYEPIYRRLTIMQLVDTAYCGNYGVPNLIFDDMLVEKWSNSRSRLILASGRLTRMREGDAA